MTAATRLKAAALPALAAVLVSGVLAVQLANGGGHYSPLRPADPCATRQVDSVSTGIQGLTEQLVLIGLDNAACRLGTSREALTLQLAQSKGAPTDSQINALRSGLLAAVDRLKAQGKLPPASQLADEALDDSNLNGFLKAAIRVLPASLIDNALATDDVLRRTITNLDLRTLLANLGNNQDLTTQVNAAVTKAVTDTLTARLRTLL
jgi:hypothetical protein